MALRHDETKHCSNQEQKDWTTDYSLKVFKLIKYSLGFPFSVTKCMNVSFGICDLGYSITCR